jgi:hypothetical protein
MSTPDDLLENIGHATLDLVSGESQLILLYAEVDEQMMALDVFYRDTAGVVHYKQGSTALADLVRELWREARQGGKQDEWCVLCYAINGLQMNIDLTYPNSINPLEGVPERRPRALNKYFGTITVDYSDP